MLVWIMVDKVECVLGESATAARKTAGVPKLFGELSPNPRLPGGYASAGPQCALNTGDNAALTKAQSGAMGVNGGLEKTDYLGVGYPATARSSLRSTIRKLVQVFESRLPFGSTKSCAFPLCLSMD